MSGRGRCVCGFTGSACKVHAHQLECELFAAAYRTGSEGLDPVQAYAAWAEGGRKAARDAVHAVSVADTDRRREVMAERFATRDVLAED